MNWWQVTHFGRLSTDSLCASAHPGGDNNEENEQRIEHHRNAHHRTSVHDAIPFPALLIICSLQPVEAAVSSSYVGRSLHVPVSRARRIRNEAGSRPAASDVGKSKNFQACCASPPDQPASANVRYLAIRWFLFSCTYYFGRLFPRFGFIRIHKKNTCANGPFV